MTQLLSSILLSIVLIGNNLDFKEQKFISKEYEQCKKTLGDKKLTLEEFKKDFESDEGMICHTFTEQTEIILVNKDILIKNSHFEKKYTIVNKEITNEYTVYQVEQERIKIPIYIKQYKDRFHIYYAKLNRMPYLTFYLH